MAPHPRPRARRALHPDRGSQLSGTPTRASDLDIAVKFGADLSERERFEKRCFLSGDLQGEDRPFIDVSDIESLPLDVAHDAVNGELLCGDEGTFERFKTDTEAKFDEQRETLRRRQRAVIDRIAEDGLRG
ncbi:nucleotidyltransferase domain-containing protein [Halorubrum aquaticum]|uniref:nucleotidyltransferase domain-containing protein n=1 Tax=Halorubrum aquaticum TaxID=387340 RepID=UPI00122CD388